MENIREDVIYSEKYNMSGKLVEFGNGLVNKLIFSYGGRQYEIGLESSFKSPFYKKEKGFEERARELMESYIDMMQGTPKERHVKMYYWYVDEMEVECDVDSYKRRRLHGNVTGHDRFIDSAFINTSSVLEMFVDYEKEELVVQTKNTLYHCPLAYCRFKKQDTNGDLIPEYETLKEKYAEKRYVPRTDPGTVLTVFSNFDEYYFNSLWVIPQENSCPVDFTAWPHVGMCQDSFLINAEDGSVDIRYFPHFQYMEFYSAYIEGELPWYIENIGDVDLYFKTSVGVLQVEPGTRKLVCKDNVENEVPVLGKGDLYPAGF